MKFRSILAAALLLVTPAARAQVFDNHVHLWKGEQSLREYEAQIKADGRAVTGFGGMWFGGPNQALAGQPIRIRASTTRCWH